MITLPRRCELVVIALTSLLFILPGCDLADVGPTTPLDQVTKDTNELAIGPYDRELFNIARDYPGFGGMFFDESGALIVYLTEPDAHLTSSVSKSSLAGRLQSLIGSSSSDAAKAATINVLQGQYDFRELAELKTSLVDILDFSHVVLVDIDERINRLVIGVKSDASVDQVEEIVAKSGLPTEAIAIQIIEPKKSMATLSSKIRPLSGGLKTERSGSGFDKLCTLGFNVVHGTYGKGFITNSHCTKARGGNQGTIFYQPEKGLITTNEIGTEAIDPDWTSTARGCPAGMLCRESDAAYIDYSVSPSGATVGRIMKTQYPGTYSGSTTISGPYFYINGENPYAVVGQQVNKMGHATGWTQGNVVRACADEGVAGTNYWLFCQTDVTAGSAGGDSGSPVFQIISGNSVQLNGILWGGTGTEFGYSPIHLIEREIGAFDTY